MKTEMKTNKVLIRVDELVPGDVVSFVYMRSEGISSFRSVIVGVALGDCAILAMKSDSPKRVFQLTRPIPECGIACRVYRVDLSLASNCVEAAV